MTMGSFLAKERERAWAISLTRLTMAARGYNGTSEGGTCEALMRKARVSLLLNPPVEVLEADNVIKLWGRSFQNIALLYRTHPVAQAGGDVITISWTKAKGPAFILFPADL
jgi:hypothetical protein